MILPFLASGTFNATINPGYNFSASPSRIQYTVYETHENTYFVASKSCSYNKRASIIDMYFEYFRDSIGVDIYISVLHNVVTKQPNSYIKLNGGGGDVQTVIIYCLC